MSKDITTDQFVDIMVKYLDWSIAYIKAARRGDTTEMERLDREFDPQKMIASAIESDRSK